MLKKSIDRSIDCNCVVRTIGCNLPSDVSLWTGNIIAVNLPILSYFMLLLRFSAIFFMKQLHIFYKDWHT